MKVREILASLGDRDDNEEVFVVTSSDGTHIDGKVAVDFVEELPLLGGAPVLAVVPRYAVLPTPNRPMLRLAQTEETKPAA